MTGDLAQFDPYAQLAAALRHWLPDARDGSHDLTHLARVWGFARQIQLVEGGSPTILFAASFLHDCVHVEKNDPSRHLAASRSAARASEILRHLGWPAERVAAVAHAIEAHSFTAGTAPRTMEARILRDADRLDSSGLVGIARCFYVAGRIGSSLYHASDPLGEDRRMNDMHYALDHFHTRLLLGTEGFYTATARDIASRLRPRVLAFRNGFLAETGRAPAEAPAGAEHVDLRRTSILSAGTCDPLP